MLANLDKYMNEKGANEEFFPIICVGRFVILTEFNRGLGSELPNRMCSRNRKSSIRGGKKNGLRKCRIAHRVNKL